MPQDITKIPLSELQEDLEASKEDMFICELALSQDIHQYSGRSVQERLDKNKYFVNVIESELLRRQYEDRQEEETTT